MPLQATSGAASYDAFGGGVPVVPNYIEEVFSTYLYTGNGSTQTITNGIDLSTKGGLVWTKRRDGISDNVLFDTNRGIYKRIQSNNTNAQSTVTDSLTAFNTNGFSVGLDQNYSNETMASWTFRKQPKFFDVVTFVGTGGSQVVNHNLQSLPGFIIFKDISDVGNWNVFARNAAGNYELLRLNGTNDSLGTNTATFYGITSTSFSPNVFGTTNGDTYVAYLFAHNAGGFGLTGTDNVISCGSVTSDGSGSASVNLGWEPQWVLLKNATGAQYWYVVDNMRGLFAKFENGNALFPNSASGETASLGTSPWITSTGMEWNGSYNPLDASSTYIYIAIRRGPMKVPTSGTSVFKPTTYSGNNGTQTFSTGFVPDVLQTLRRTGTGTFINYNVLQSRLQGLRFMYTFLEDAEQGLLTEMPNWGSTTNTLSITTSAGNQDLFNKTSSTYVNYQFKRAPSFMDVVCYTGTGSNTTQAHNLGVVPELIIVKRRDTTDAWDSYSSALANTEYVVLNTTAAKATGATRWNSTTPTSSVFSVGTSTTTNASAGTYVAHLFATCAGVSKVGSYTGTATTLQIDCGFTAGARFVLIKRTDSTGDWYVWDSARGIIAGNDPYLRLNSSVAEVTNTDYVDTYSAGFEISSTAPAAINASGGSFIFLAIA